MKILLQRVTQADVSVDGATVSRVGPGLLAFLGLERDDRRSTAEQLLQSSHLSGFRGCGGAHEPERGRCSG